MFFHGMWVFLFFSPIVFLRRAESALPAVSMSSAGPCQVVWRGTSGTPRPAPRLHVASGRPVRRGWNEKVIGGAYVLLFLLLRRRRRRRPRVSVTLQRPRPVSQNVGEKDYKRSIFGTSGAYFFCFFLRSLFDTINKTRHVGGGDPDGATRRYLIKTTKKKKKKENRRNWLFARYFCGAYDPRGDRSAQVRQNNIVRTLNSLSPAPTRPYNHVVIIRDNRYYSVRLYFLFFFTVLRTVRFRTARISRVATSAS